MKHISLSIKYCGRLKPVFLTFAIIFTLAWGAAAQISDDSGLLRNFNERLAKARGANDSITLLLNIMDIAQHNPRLTNPDSVSVAIYDIAVRTNNWPTAYEMLRMRSNSYAHSVGLAEIDSLISKARGLPDMDAKNETLAFLQMRRNTIFTFYADIDHDEQERRFDDMLRKLTLEKPGNIYEQIYVLHALSLYLYKISDGDLMVNYFDRLLKLVDELPGHAYSLRNMAKVQAALAFSLAGKWEKAIETDRRLLALLDELEKYYDAQGRPYRSYNSYRYVVYTRLLGNWEHLSEDDIENYHRLALEYKDKDVRAQSTYRRLPMPDIYYAMWKGDYAKVQEELRDFDFLRREAVRTRTLLPYLIKAAAAVGDHATEHRAMQEYIKWMEKRITVTERDRELQVLFDTYRMREELARRESEQLLEKQRLQGAIIVICLVALVGLLILLFFYVRLYRHSRRLADTLAASNEALKQESCSLRASQRELAKARDAAQEANRFKSDFIRNITHEITLPLNTITEYSRLLIDCSDSSRQPYLDRYARLVETNSEYLLAIVNDVLCLSEIDRKEVTIRRSPTQLLELLELTVEAIRPSLHEGVKIEVNPDSEDIVTCTDSRRVQQILNNLLENAAKFTDSGRITVGCHLVRDGKEIVITVTDTGCGISPADAERIYERFAKLDDKHPGIGLGLPISRMLARLLGGELSLDTTYTHGTRFVFRLPYVN